MEYAFLAFIFLNVVLILISNPGRYIKTHHSKPNPLRNITITLWIIFGLIVVMFGYIILSTIN